MRQGKLSPVSDYPALGSKRTIVTLCKAALAGKGSWILPMRVVRVKGLDEADAVLRTSVALRIVQAMNLQTKRGKASDAAKQRGARVWAAR